MDPKGLPKIPDATRADKTKPAARPKPEAPPQPPADRSKLDAAEKALKAIDERRKREEADPTACRARLSDADRHLQHQQRQQAPGQLDRWLETARPDVVCLQELKAEDRAFPRAAIEAAGYGAVWRGQSAWNGVAILAKGATPVLTRRTLPGDPADDQARYIEGAVNGILIASIYLPNGNPQPGPKFAYKLAWFARLNAHAAELMEAGVPVVLRAITMSCRPKRISGSAIMNRTMLCSSPKAGRRSNSCSTRAGQTP